MSHDPTFWLLARASGLTAYVLLTLAVLAGITVKTRVLGRAVRASSTVDVHRFLTTLALGALAIHGATLVLDTTVRITPLALLVPGLSPYRPLPTGLGVLAAELMGLVVLSFRFRRRIGMRAWRSLHFATYPIFLLATAHGLLARHGLVGAVGVRPLRRRGRCGRRSDHLARPHRRPPTPSRKEQRHDHLPHHRRPHPVQRVRHL